MHYYWHVNLFHKTRLNKISSKTLVFHNLPFKNLSLWDSLECYLANPLQPSLQTAHTQCEHERVCAILNQLNGCSTVIGYYIVWRKIGPLCCWLKLLTESDHLGQPSIDTSLTKLSASEVQTKVPCLNIYNFSGYIFILEGKTVFYVNIVFCIDIKTVLLFL